MTLVNDRHIDCVVRKDRGKGKPEYLDIHMKARSAEGRNAGRFAHFRVTNPRPNYWFIFYSEPAETYWVIPSLELIKLAYKGKSSQSKGSYSVELASRVKSGWRAAPRFRKYENAFELLR